MTKEQLLKEIKKLKAKVAQLEKKQSSQDIKGDIKKEKIFFETILNSTVNGILVTNYEGKVVYANSLFTSMWKIPDSLMKTESDEKLVQFVLDQLIDPKAFIKKITQLYHLKKSSFDTLYFKDGRIFERYSCPLIKGKKLFGRVWSFQDVTESKKIVNALHNRLKYERSIALSLQALMTDFENGICTTIKYLLEATGVSRVYVFENFKDKKDGLCCKQIYEVVTSGVEPQIDNPELQHVPWSFIPRWPKLLSKNKPIVGLVENFPKNERTILEPQNILSILVLPINVHNKWYGFIGFDDTKKKRHWNKEDMQLLHATAEMIGIVIARSQGIKKIKNEVAERKKTERELKNAYEKLQNTQIKLIQTEKMAGIGQLAAGIAHEINNPTGYIINNLNVLEKYIKDIFSIILKVKNDPNIIKEVNKKDIDVDYLLKDIPDLIIETVEGAERIKKIVNNLKDFAHPSHKQNQLIDINAEVNKIIPLVWIDIKYTCEVIKSFSDIPSVYCIPQEIDQVLINLMINASQSIHHKDGRIIIKTYPEDNNVVIEITDNGQGIPEENLAKIFDPFFTTKEVGKGTGLGLSIAYGIIESHKGKIEVKSRINKGTTFTIRLPAKPGE